MCKKFIFLVSLVLVLGLVLTSAAGAADPDLVGWWKLDEGSGDTAIDLSGSGNDGTVHYADSGGMDAGGSAWFNDLERGMVLSFNGDNSSGAYVSTDLIIPAMTMENDFTWAFWGKQEGDGTGVNEMILGNRFSGTQSPLQFIKFTPTRFEFFNDDYNYEEGINYEPVPGDEWVHHVVVKDGTSLTYYRNGEEAGTNTITKTIDENPFYIGGEPEGYRWAGRISDARLYTKALTVPEILGAMEGSGEIWPYASSPNPADGALHEDTWVSLSWRPGPFAVSHDVYLGDNFDDVNNGTPDSPVFRGNQGDSFMIAGFAGFPYPDGLVHGKTYYWRIDEVNEAEPNSPWKGEIWSFSIPPKTAYDPVPSDGAEAVALDADFSWTGGFGAKLHAVYFGDNFDHVSNAAGGAPQGAITFTPPGPLELAKTYYWRVDEFDPPTTYKGDVWSFTTEGTATNPNPAKGAVDVSPTPILKWTPASLAASHEVYLGADADAVKNATKASPEYKETKALGEESYDAGRLELMTTHYWRIDEVNGTNPGSPWIGNVWDFTTGDFLVVDDFEAYNDIDPPDEASNRIFDNWIDGFGTTTNGALVGNDLPPYAEQTIVHGGAQSMPYFYDNANKTSEATLTLVYPRDWTEGGTTKLSLWFRGASANAADRMYVALNGTAVVYHDDSAATQLSGWKKWVIDLAAFGVDLTNVNSITIGVGTKNAPAPGGGTGTLYFDDIRLIR